MTIRKTLLVGFLGLGLGSAILLTALAFVKAREALRAEIDRNVRTGADALAAEIDRMMFERLQNAAAWSRLDIAQDMQIRDIDKRLSQFLAELRQGYRDVYLNLCAIDRDGNIIASSDAALVGQAAAAHPAWLRTSLWDEPLTLALQRDRDIGVLIDVPIASKTGAGSLGTLRLVLDWSGIAAALDHAAGESGRMVVLLDADGRVIGASRALRDRAPATLDESARWRPFAGKVTQQDGSPFVDGAAIVGVARTPGYAQFPGFGWTVLIVQPVADALAPVHRMAVIFLLLLGVIGILTALIALWTSQAIARPIVALTAFARHYVGTRVLEAPPSGGMGEVGELSDAFVQMVRDIDASQKKLVTASKLAVIGEMSSVIAHEVRTPLGIIRSSAQVIAREAGISAEARELAGFIGSETERLNRLVSAMLDSAHPRAPALVDVDMHELLRRTVAMLGAQLARKDIRVTLALRAADARIRCDEEQMTQVILNILMNAMQVLGAGGGVDVETRDAGAVLEIDIADDGPGIGPHERAHVFDAFFFRREGGVGLGLAIVQQIVQTHGGTVTAGQSTHGGALFRLRLPRGQESTT